MPDDDPPAPDGLLLGALGEPADGLDALPLEDGLEDGLIELPLEDGLGLFEEGLAVLPLDGLELDPELLLPPELSQAASERAERNAAAISNFLSIMHASPSVSAKCRQSWHVPREPITGSA